MTETAIEGKKTLFEISVETSTIIGLLDKLEIGETIPYKTMSDAICRDITKEGNGHLQTAKRRLLHDSGKVFETVRKVGVRRIDQGKVVDCDNTFEKIRKVSHRGRKRLQLGVTDFDSLTNAQKIKHNATVSFLGMVEYVSKPKQVKQIEESVVNAASKQPPLSILGLFSKKEGEREAQ